MNRSNEVWPLGVVEAAIEVWPRMGHSAESPQREPYPNPFDNTLAIHHPGDIVRWDEVRLSDGIAFRKITVTRAETGRTDGMLAVYGRVTSDKFSRSGWEAVSVDPVPPWKRSGVQDDVLADYRGYLRGLGLSSAGVEGVVSRVVFMTEDGWVAGEEMGEDEI